MSVYVSMYVLRSPSTLMTEIPRAQSTEEREVKSESRALLEVFGKEARVKIQS